MAVRKRLDTPRLEHADIDALIDKGAKVKEDNIAEKKKWTYISLRIPLSMIEDIDDSVEDKVGITRTGWILQALQEKLQREENEND